MSKELNQLYASYSNEAIKSFFSLLNSAAFFDQAKASVEAEWPEADSWDSYYKFLCDKAEARLLADASGVKYHLALWFIRERDYCEGWLY